LSDLLPSGAVKNAAPVTVEDGVTLNQIIDKYKVPRELAHLVLINGVFVCDTSKDMGVSHADFFRLLPRAMGDIPYRVEGTTVNGEIGSGTVSIELGKQQERRIALLAIPFAEVTFSFNGVGEDERTEFMRYFDLRFQRGGG